MFSCDIWGSFKNSYFEEHQQMTASKISIKVRGDVRDDQGENFDQDVQLTEEWYQKKFHDGLCL